jgi:hypothetical protein
MTTEKAQLSSLFYFFSPKEHISMKGFFAKDPISFQELNGKINLISDKIFERPVFRSLLRVALLA